MSSYYVEMTFDLGRQDDPEGFEAHLDEVAEAFSKVIDVDGDVGADLEKGQVELCMTLSAEGRIDALNKAVIAAKTAIHAAGGTAPGWERLLAKLLEDDEYLLHSAPSA